MATAATKIGFRAFGALLAVCMAASRADGAPAAEAPLIPVWQGLPPGASASDLKEQDTVMPGNDRVVRNVTRPTLQPFLPEAGTANGTAVVVCPGGGFRYLTIDTEGLEVARWLSAHGIAAFVLRYRVMPTPADDGDFAGQLGALLAPLFGPGINDEMKRLGPPAIADAQQAVRLVRQRAKEWHIAPDRVGILGFSAGGVVVTGISLQHDAKSRPDFAGAIYPGPWDIGKVPKDAPPLFIAAASDDALTDIGAKPLQTAWQQAGHPVETHIYDKGGHGFGMKQQDSDSDHWIDQFGEWLDKQGLLKAKK
jgi:acetyl esterase/lipase